jgi:hypothetical protein
MHGVVGDLVRRGVDAHRNVSQITEYNMPVWGIAILIATFVLYTAIISTIEYTYGRVIATLLIIESPQAILFEPIANNDPDSTIDQKTEPDLLLVKQRPITAGFRSTINHLKSKAGFKSRFRGLSCFIIYMLAVQHVAQFIGAINFIPTGSAPVLAAVVCAQLAMCWTHIVISDPSPKPWYRRMPALRLWKKVAGPTAVLAIAEQLTVALPAYLLRAYSLNQFDPAGVSKPVIATQAILRLLSVFAVGLSLAFLLVFPANFTLTRVQASLLADTEETIVPFDRSFGGKVVPEIVGGSGVVGSLDAWRTFDWNARVRLLKLYAKVMAIQVAVSIFFIFATIVEVYAITGGNLSKLLPKDSSSKPEIIIN